MGSKAMEIHKISLIKVTHVWTNTKGPMCHPYGYARLEQYYGFFSHRLKLKRHQFLFKTMVITNKVNWPEMTMVPQRPQIDCPCLCSLADVRTAQWRVYVEDELNLRGSFLKIATRMAVQESECFADEFGLNSFLKNFLSGYGKIQNTLLNKYFRAYGNKNWDALALKYWDFLGESGTPS